MNIVEFRKTKGLSTYKFAKELGVSRSYLSKIENGIQRPGFGFIEKMKKRYPEIDVDEMFLNNKMIE